ncbi:hypothetical protein JKP88DRAFT_270148 [Tribonema minus]|uniref:RRM domain-containing protein n=1 Tax=Tribonema minus TaxID=303371 RepID=A0A835YWJ3_9STRA|nr:hypothetical protein JKP88DRAFT_270148 [Tribonema minus]
MGEANNRTVFVGNLSWNTTSEELRDFMASQGEIVSSEVQCHADSGRSKGWGLVQYSTPEEATAAIELLNNADLGGRSVHLRFDRTTIETSGGFAVFVGNLPWSVTDLDLTALFAKFNPFDAHVKTNMTGRSRGFGILRFHSPEEGREAIEAMNGFEIEGRHIQVREDREGEVRGGGGGGGGGRRAAAGGGSGAPAEGAATEAAHTSPAPAAAARKEPSGCTVFVGNLAWTTTTEDLTEHFSTMNGMVSAEVQATAAGRSKGWGLATFSTPEQATAACELMAETSLHDRRLTVRLDKK